jgi:hypothetical protein
VLSNLYLQMYDISSGRWKKVKSFVDLKSLPSDSQAKFVWYIFFNYVVVDISLYSGTV